MSNFTLGMILLPIAIVLGCVMGYIAKKFEKEHPDKAWKHRKEES